MQCFFRSCNQHIKDSIKCGQVQANAEFTQIQTLCEWALSRSQSFSLIFRDIQIRSVESACLKGSISTNNN